MSLPTLSRCPRCGEPGGRGHCPKCHGSRPEAEITSMEDIRERYGPELTVEERLDRIEARLDKIHEHLSDA